jgi:cell shape-determining protein MreC
MDSTSHSLASRAVAGCLLVAVVLAVLPESAVSSLRDLVRAAMVPGQRVAQEASDWLAGRTLLLFSSELASRDREIEQLRADLAATALAVRRAQLQAGSLQAEIDSLHRNGPSPFASEAVSPLVRERAIEARVLGADVVAVWKGQRLLDQGSSHGLVVDQWILDAADVAIDAGIDQSLSSGLPVFAGRCVVGRVVNAGRWTSSLELLTAPTFRAQAMVTRSGPRGLEFAGTGMIEGTGSGLCRLVEVGSQLAVEIGDAVYSSVETTSDTPMLFGFVTEATLEPGALHWEISVEPAANLSQLRRVQVVVPSVNPERLLGQR